MARHGALPRHAPRAARRQVAPQVVGDLIGRALLQRQSLGEAIDQLCESAKADELSLGDVGDVGDAPIREQMVWAHGVKSQPADHHHGTGISLTHYGIAQDDRRIHVVAGQKLLVPDARDALRRVAQIRLLGGIQPRGPQERVDGGPQRWYARQWLNPAAAARAGFCSSSAAARRSRRRPGANSRCAFRRASSTTRFSSLPRWPGKSTSPESRSLTSPPSVRMSSISSDNAS